MRFWVSCVSAARVDTALKVEIMTVSHMLPPESETKFLNGKALQNPHAQSRTPERSLNS